MFIFCKSVIYFSLLVAFSDNDIVSIFSDNCPVGMLSNIYLFIVRILIVSDNYPVGMLFNIYLFIVSILIVSDNYPMGMLSQ